MQVALLATKLIPPPVQRELVPRPRLIDRLNQGKASKLTLVVAPAGYGKTMLLSAWTEQCKMPVAWLSLDEGDNDPARFLSYLVAALDQILPGIGRDASLLLKSPQLPPEDELLSDLINKIADARQPFVLVLDDYHLVGDLAAHNALIYLLGHLPAQMRLVIASRSDPPLQLARLRARSELTELRLVDLCFTLEEATQFFRQVMKLDLEANQVGALTARTEGWVAGLQMAALSFKGAADPSDFVRSFSGSNRYIMDFLLEEVLGGQTEEVQSFLLATSVLERLTGSLCDAVTGLSHGQELLERLERANLFIVPLDEERSWYRYHRLFSDLLRKRAQQQSPGKVAGWQQRASLWSETHGYLEDAIEYALAAGDFGRAAGLVATAAQPTLLRGEIYTFRSWISRLPEPEVCARPDLVLFHAWVLVLTDAPGETVEAWLRRVDLGSERIASKAGVIRAYREFMQGEVTRGLALLQQSLPGLSTEETLFRSMTSWLLSLSHVVSGDFDAGSHALEELVRTSLRKKHLIAATAALCALAEIHLRLAKLPEARADYERALTIARDARGPLPVAGRALMGLSDLWREWNDLDKALRYCLDGIELAKHLRESTTIGGYITLARIQQSAGKVELSRAAMQRAWELALQTEQTSLDDLFVRLRRAHLEIMQGDLDAAGQWVEERGLLSAFNPADLDQKDNYYKYHILKYELLVAARWFIAANQPQRAVTLLSHLLTRMEAQRRVHLVIESLLLSALAYRQLGEQLQAMTCFGRALVLAEPGGHIRLFLDEGSAIRPLLQAATRAESAPDYARRLLAVLEAELQQGVQAGPIQPAFPPQASGVVEPLTERELELLALIAEGLSNREIADRLFITLPTVKWHTSNIYGKLGVRSRTQALLRARSLGIVPAG